MCNYIYKAHVSEYLNKIWPYIVQHLHFRVLKRPLSRWRFSLGLAHAMFDHQMRQRYWCNRTDSALKKTNTINIYKSISK